MHKLDCPGEDHDVKLKKVKEMITHGNNTLQAKIQILEVLKSSQSTAESPESILKLKNETSSVKKSLHPGFVISFDNIDVQLKKMEHDIFCTKQGLSLG